jgi:hypothetical protein
MIEDSKTKVFAGADIRHSSMTRGSTRGALTMAIEVSRLERVAARKLDDEVETLVYHLREGVAPDRARSGSAAA